MCICLVVYTYKIILIPAYYLKTKFPVVFMIMTQKYGLWRTNNEESRAVTKNILSVRLFCKNLSLL